MVIAVERKILRGRRLRIDTTVTEADVAYPTDSGLCATAIERIGRSPVTRIKQVRARSWHALPRSSSGSQEVEP